MEREPLTLLVVDDDENGLDVLTKYLGEGYRVRVGKSPGDGPVVSLDAARSLSGIGADGFNHVLLDRSPDRPDASSGLICRGVQI